METVLARYSRPGTLWEKLDHGKVRCYACGHRCVIFEGKPGVCRVRHNRGGVLYVPHGYAAALQLDPIEKKPFFHALPGARALSFGMLGCDLRCAYCQNWDISQTGRDPEAGRPVTPLSPEMICDMAARDGARVLTSTYNEPLITSEWAVEVFREARARGFTTSYVSNGNATPEVLKFIRPWVDLYKVDLKSFSDPHYRRLGGNLNKVLDGVRRIYAMGFWLEAVTLVVPGFNDSDGELRDMARFLKGVSPDIPWHVTAFHKDYKMRWPEETPARTLRRAAETGLKEGLRYVYAGNLPGEVGDLENTRCPKCRELLVERRGFLVKRDRLTPAGGRCPECGTVVPGRWDARPAPSQPKRLP